MENLFGNLFETEKRQTKPLADRMRPERLSDFVGQESAVGAGSPLRRMIDIHYSGTKNAWNIISIYSSNDPIAAATIHCTDGDIVHNTENSITTGTASTSGYSSYMYRSSWNRVS